MFNTVLLHCYNSSLTYLNKNLDQMILSKYLGLEIKYFWDQIIPSLFSVSSDISSLTFIWNNCNNSKDGALIWYSQCYMLLLHKRRFLLPIEVSFPPIYILMLSTPHSVSQKIWNFYAGGCIWHIYITTKYLNIHKYAHFADFKQE